MTGGGRQLSSTASAAVAPKVMLITLEDEETGIANLHTIARRSIWEYTYDRFGARRCITGDGKEQHKRT